MSLRTAISRLRYGRAGGPLVTLLLLAACGTGRSARVTARFDTLASGTVVVHNPDRGMWGDRPAWSLGDAVAIGSRRDSGKAAFGQVWDVALDQLGRVYVLDHQAQEIRVFGRDGSYIRTIARSGHGPGELAIPSGMRFDPHDRLWVLNSGNQRYSVFDTSGALVREFPRRTSTMFLEWRDGAFSATGDLYDFVSLPTEQGRASKCGRYDTLTSAFVDSVPCPVLPVGTPMGWGRIVPTPSGWWVAVASAYRLWELTREGDTARVIEREHETVDLPAAQRDSIREAMGRLQRRAHGAVDLPIPERQRMFDNIVVDNRGYVWVQLSRSTDERRTSFDVFDPDGRYLGAVETPFPVDPRPTPVVRDDRMAFVTTDEPGAQVVVTARVRGRR